jgi:hypothetical protein
MSRIFAFYDTFKAAAGPHWVRTAIVIATATYTFVSLANDYAENHGFGFLIPTVPKIAYTLGALAILLVFWFWKYAHNLRLESLPRLELVKIHSHINRLSETVLRVTVSLFIRNVGSTALTNCVVKVIDQSDPKGSFETFSPRPIGPEVVRVEEASVFHLRGGEPKEITICHCRHTKGDTFAQVVMCYLGNWSTSFDPQDRPEMTIGLFSESPPRIVKLKFDWAKDTVLSVTEDKE